MVAALGVALAAGVYGNGIDKGDARRPPARRGSMATRARIASTKCHDPLGGRSLRLACIRGGWTASRGTDVTNARMPCTCDG